MLRLVSRPREQEQLNGKTALGGDGAEPASKPPRGPSPRTKPLERPGPEGGKRAENRKQRISALETAALRLFLQYGVEAVTIDQIVDGAQTAKGSFYRYYRDKEDLVEAIMAPISNEVRDIFDRCEASLRAEANAAELPKHYQALGEQLFRIVLQYPEVVRLYLHESRGPKSGARVPIVALAEDVLDRATLLSDIAREQAFLRPLAGRLSAIVVVGAVDLLLSRVLAGDEIENVIEMPQKLVSLVLDGVRARPGESLKPAE
jgi:AcrR family transcriptional regulator